MSNNKNIDSKIVFVTIPRSFVFPYAVRQENCINSLKIYNRDSEIILYSDDNGINEYARKHGYISPKIIKKYKHLPLVNQAITYAAKKFPNSKICFINSDILVLSNLLDVLKKIESLKLFEYMTVCRRTEISLETILANNQFDSVIKNYKKNNERGKNTAIDFFMFPSNVVNKINMPDFPVGRVGWDNWLAARARILKMPLIDISDVIVIAHQDHELVHDKSGWNTNWIVWTKHGISNFSSLLDCNYKIVKRYGVLKLNFNILGSVIGSKIFRLFRAYLRICLFYIKKLQKENFTN